MSRVLVRGVVLSAVLLLGGTLAGCSPRAGADRLEPLIRAKVELNEQRVRLLQGVKDGSDLDGLWPVLAEHNRREADLAGQFAALPRPSPETLAPLAPYTERLRAAADAQRAEYRRIAGLPGGEAFLRKLHDLSTVTELTGTGG